MEAQFESYLQSQLPTISIKSAKAVIQLAETGATVPFMARYRKEKTGNLDEVAIREVIDCHARFQEILQRKAFILTTIEKQGNLTKELKGRIEKSMDLGELEEIYRPYKKKKKTKATIAREAGIEPFADWIWKIGHGEIQPEATLEVKAKEFINPAAQFATYNEVLKGAQDILVERLSNLSELRDFVRDHLLASGKVTSKAGKEYKQHSKYEMYTEYSELLKNLFERKASHRYLAMRRGWKEGELVVNIEGDEAALLGEFERAACPAQNSSAADFLKSVAKAALQVHVMPSIANEIHRQLKEKADDHAITVFAENVKQVLLASPFGAKCVLGVDPGIRTGCKLALVDKQGNFISHTVITLHEEGAEARTKKLFEEVLKQIQIEAIAVGNGTGGREAERFLRKILKDLGHEIPVVLISEAGASVYSASDVAREEFPDLDLTVRGAVSIARRLQDPLAELVKVEPKSIGVGQYQHDVSQTHLKKKLEEVVESCVNQVGVDLNTASESLLKYVSGIGPALAKNVVDHRRKNGLFTNRDDLLKVERFSAKVFEQAAGFLRLYNSKMVLDRTGIHPERYPAVRDMANELGVTLSDLVGEGAKKLMDLRTKWAELIGQYTFDDIVRELQEPGRDPRDPFHVFQFREDISDIKDLKPGMIASGVVTNVTNFGAFVDIGVHQNGLVHISELSQQFVDDPKKVVKPGDQVKVKVLTVDLEKNQIALSMKLTEEKPARPKAKPRSDAPRAAQDGSRRPARNAKDGRKGGGKPHPSRDKKSSGGDRDRRGPRPAAQPFNNPFAALAGIKSETTKR